MGIRVALELQLERSDEVFVPGCDWEESWSHETGIGEARSV